MQEGEYGRARPLLDRAVAGLAGTGAITEAYASYNLAFTRFALGSCDGVLPSLDRSEDVQGERREIDALREDWDDRCAEAKQTANGARARAGEGRQGLTLRQREASLLRELREDLVVLGKSSFRLLGEDHLPVGHHVELRLRTRASPLL